MGNSYGGYLAPKMLTMYPKEITGAIAINGVYDWRTLLEDLQTSIFNIHFGGLYNQNNATKERYAVASITDNIDALTKKDKILLVTGTADRTINPQQAYTFAKLLKSERKNVKSVLLKGEDHVLTQVSSNVTLCSEVFKFVGLKKFKNACTLK
jgi:dipeptidyl aminopeptidase/acylaminoacyl peptidase